MIQVYVMDTCPDCAQVKVQLKDNPKYVITDIGAHVRNLKAFLRLRDNHPAFDAIKAGGSIGITCFVMEDGRVVFDLDEVITDDKAEGGSCSIDGKGC